MTNGFFINLFVAPMYLIINISRLFEYTASFIVFEIINILTTSKTTPIPSKNIFAIFDIEITAFIVDELYLTL